MRVVVTAEDVREARKPENDPITKCAVALAITRVLPAGTIVEVTTRALWINDPGREREPFDLGDDVEKFIVTKVFAYGMGMAPEAVTPFEFDLEFGDEVSACS